MLIVVPLAVLIVGYQYFTKVDRSDAIKVATAFTKALHSKNLGTAAGYYTPADAQAWRENIDGMRSGSSDRYFERIPADPAFTAPVTSKAGITTITSGDKNFSLEMKQIDGKWYVSKTL